MANSVTFVTMEDLEDIMGAHGYQSYLLVVADTGEEPVSLANRIVQEVEKVNALPRDRFVARDRKMALAMGTEIVWIMTRIGGVVAMLIVAFAAYSQVTRLQGEFALLKALGFRRGQLAIAGLIQSVTLTSAGLLICVVLSCFLLPVLPELAPQVSVLVTREQLMRVAVAAMPVAALASLLPILRIARVDPTSVFRT
jgi:ABC-type lipoprotein release transport system permease subunit